MFRLYNRSFVSICSKCETLKSSCSSLVSRKNTNTVQDDKRSLEKPICNNYHHDALDVYTSSLVLENMTKWKTDSLSVAGKVSLSKTNSIFQSCDDPDHLITYLQRCLDGHCKINKTVLSKFMSTMARHGRINGLILIKRINEKYGYCIKKSELQINLAEAHWTNGNLDEMFAIFETFYPAESMRANFILEPIIFTIVNSRGVASVVMVSKFVHLIVRKHGDHCPMSILWKYLFLSELYSDNLEAEKLIRKNSYLMENIQYLIPSITKGMLEKHKVDCVQRLMMMLLKYKQMKSYQWILRTLFEYHCEYLFLNPVQLKIFLL